MKCSRCGAEVPDNNVKIFNGNVLCDKCIQDLGYSDMFKSVVPTGGNPIEKMAGLLFNMNNLDFGNSTVNCPKCGMSLREFEKTGRLGCIECFNTFNTAVDRELLKLNGDTVYMGRLPGKYEATAVGSEEEFSTDESVAGEDEKAEENLDVLRKADLGMLEDEALQKGIEQAVVAEDYKLAARLRDELKGRKGE